MTKLSDSTMTSGSTLGSWKKAAIHGAATIPSTENTVPPATLAQNTVARPLSVTVSTWTIAPPRPRSANAITKLEMIRAIPATPKSCGPRVRARITATPVRLSSRSPSDKSFHPRPLRMRFPSS